MQRPWQGSRVQKICSSILTNEPLILLSWRHAFGKVGTPKRWQPSIHLPKVPVCSENRASSSPRIWPARIRYWTRASCSIGSQNVDARSSHEQRLRLGTLAIRGPVDLAFLVYEAGTGIPGYEVPFAELAQASCYGPLSSTSFATWFARPLCLPFFALVSLPQPGI